MSRFAWNFTWVHFVLWEAKLPSFIEMYQEVAEKQPLKLRHMLSWVSQCGDSLCTEWHLLLKLKLLKYAIYTWKVSYNADHVNF